MERKPTYEELEKRIHELQAQIERLRSSEEALRESQACYQAMVAAFDGFMYVCSQDYRIEFMNEAFTKHLGFNAVGRHCYKILHDRDEVCQWCVNERVFSGETVRWEIQSPRDQRWYYVVNSPIYHPDGRLSKQAMITDITERKQMENVVSAKRQILEMVARGLPFVETLSTLLTIIEEQIPEAFCAILLLDSSGYRLNHVCAPSLPEDYLQAIDNVDVESESHVCARAIRAGRRVIVEDLAKDLMGQTFCDLISRHRFCSCWCIPIKDSTDKPLGTLTLYRRVSGSPSHWEKQLLETAASLAGIVIERGKWEAALEESERRYKSLFEQSPIGLMELDISALCERILELEAMGVDDWRSHFKKNRTLVSELEQLCEVIDVNKAYLDLYHVDRKSDLGRGFRTIFGQEGTDMLREGLIAIAEGRNGFRGETIVAIPNGESKYIAFKWSFPEDVADRTCSLLVSVIDISELKALEREKANITAMFAHDMKSALVIIQGFVMRLLNHSLDIDESKRNQYLNIIRREAAKLEFMMDDFLELTRLQSGTLQLETSPTSLDKELQELIETYQNKAMHRSIELQLKNLEILPVIEADVKRLRRVFCNLLDNALKFSRPHSTIIIEALEGRNSIALRFADQGIGIAKEDLPHIFDPFHRGGGASRYDGWGVGLAAVKTIVEGHGGHVLVESKQGKGSVFTVILPKKTTSSSVRSD